MVVITVEEPKKRKKIYRISSRQSADQIIVELEKIAKRPKGGVGKLGKIDFSDVFGIWADRKESAEEIARNLRAGWNRDDAWHRQMTRRRVE